MTESDFIAALRATARFPEARGLADDCAVRGDLVLTHDMMVAGTHFPLTADPADVAWKLVGVNLSDLAAKGATPLGVLLGYMLGEDDWDRRFADALGEALDHYGAALWGGDTVRAPTGSATRAIGLTAVGCATHLPVPSRSGAQAGDVMWVTGTIGAAMLGFEADRGGNAASDAALSRFRRPVPRIAEGIALAPHVTAMMDVSDGLLLDAQRMAQASGVTIALDSAAVPVAAGLPDALHGDAMRWGDDYELLFTLPADTLPPVEATRIGSVLAQQRSPLLVDGMVPPGGQALGYQH